MSVRPIFIVGWMILLMSVGCQPTWHPPLDLKSGETLPTRVKGTADAVMIKQMTALEKQGVRVIAVGQNYLVSIPTSRLFANQSPRLLWSSYDILNSVIAFLSQFRKIAVNVTGYGAMDNTSDQRELALSKARAIAVANYVWSQGIDSRLVFAEGVGARRPILKGNSSDDGSTNSRIEITFKDAVA